jgi:hypothetical protein
MTSTDALLSTKAFSKRSGIPTSTLQKWLRNGKLTGTKKNRRWYIPESELALTSTPPNTPQNSTPKPEQKAGTPHRTYSVPEFSALTYLTEFGVRNFLKSGRLLGEQAEDGSWKVKAESLDLPDLRHLIR